MQSRQAMHDLHCNLCGQIRSLNRSDRLMCPDSGKAKKHPGYDRPDGEATTGELGITFGRCSEYPAHMIFSCRVSAWIR